MKQWFKKSARFFISNFFLFLLGLHGIPFFVWIQHIMFAVDATLFGTTCTWICAAILLFIQMKK
ncbi:hypothetical protein HPK19_07430 [Arthrobacter citreus]|nr:hypothetical protein HPK19_07430 [Arthrobacter citreus]